MLVAGFVGVATSAATVSAAVTNPGAVTLDLTSANLTLDSPPDLNGSFDTIGTLRGTIESSGALRFGARDIVMRPIPSLWNGITMEWTPTAISDFVGSVDPARNTFELRGTMSLFLNSRPLGLVDCPIGPMTLTLRGGAPTSGTGAFTLRDASFVVHAVPNPSCNGLAPTLNAALMLPTAPGTSTYAWQGRMSTQPVLPVVSINDVRITEPTRRSADAVLTVQLSAPARAAVKVKYATNDGAGSNAMSGSDFVAKSGSVQIKKGATTAVVKITIRADDRIEGLERFQVVLSAPTNATLGDAVACVRIEDSD
jgi:hypothetical protein